jgi:hypothetical protein
MMDSKNHVKEDGAIAVIGNDSTLTDLVDESSSSTSTSTTEIPELPYSIYSTKEKWFIVGVVAVAGLFR